MKNSPLKRVNEPKQSHSLGGKLNTNLKWFWDHIICGKPALRPAGTSAPEIGLWGENWALWFFQRNYNAALLERNWRGAQGEIDFILRDHNTLVFVEVKTRHNLDKSPMKAAMDPTRVGRWQRAAQEYFNQLPPLRPQVRFDVIIVQNNESEFQDPIFEHFPGVITPVNFR